MFDLVCGRDFTGGDDAGALAAIAALQDRTSVAVDDLLAIAHAVARLAHEARLDVERAYMEDRDGNSDDVIDDDSLMTPRIPWGTLTLSAESGFSLHSPALDKLEASGIESAAPRLAISDHNSSSSSSGADSLISEGVTFPEAIGRSSDRTAAQSLYVQGQKLVAEGRISARKIRLQYTGSEDSEDFLARLHCVRAASTVLFSDKAFRAYVLHETGRLLSAVVVAAGEDPAQGFTVCYFDLKS